MKQDGLKSVGWIGWPRLRMRLSIAGIEVPPCRSSGVSDRNEKKKSQRFEESTAMRQFRSSVPSEIYQSGQRKRAASRFSALSRHPFHGALKQKDGEGPARCPSCSQNAHGDTVLVRCAQ